MPARYPQHVTIRLKAGAPKVARDWLMKIIREAIRDSQKSASFRIVEFNVLDNHLHLITEAAGKRELCNGVSGLEIRIVQRLNAALHRTGGLFERYHVRYLMNPTQVRNAVKYVVFN